MKKRAAKTKATSKSKRAAKPSAARPAAKTMQATRASGGAYQPPPLKSDGWPPFRYQA